VKILRKTEIAREMKKIQHKDKKRHEIAVFCCIIRLKQFWELND
jgi:hypothetical protein